MRIAQIAPVVERVPPKKYGGTERIVYHLTEELVRRGHDVTLFASGDSITSARLVASSPRALREARVADIYGPNIWTLLNIGRAYAMQDEFDVIHDHTMPLSLPAANIARTPVVGTNHGGVTEATRDLFVNLVRPSIVSISRSQVDMLPGINHAGVVYNGLPLSHYPFARTHKGYLLFVGRICLEKGTHFAVQVARALGKKLIIAGKVDTVDEAYFHEYVEPYLTGNIQWVGEVDEEERNRLMRDAECLLHPVTWMEPFGLVLIEAAACGCPVIAFNKGSIPEVVVDGGTGFVVNDMAEMVAAVRRVGSIDRAVCREHVLANFTAERMTDGYEAVYRRLIADRKEGIRTFTSPIYAK